MVRDARARRLTTLRVGLDAHHLERHEGNRTYALNLLRGLAALPPDHRGEMGLDGGLEVVAYSALEGELPEGPLVRHARLPRAPSWLRVPLVAPWLQRRDRLDLWHSAWVAPPVGAAPSVLTLHDVLWETRPDLFRRAIGMRLRALVPGSVRAAARVIVTSRTTRDALLSAYPFADPARVVHVPFGIDLAAFSAAPREDDDARRAAAIGPRADRPYVLSVGRLDPRKDLPGLMAALARVRPGPDGIALALVGPHRGHEPALRATCAAAGLDPARLVVVADAPEPTLAALYRGCAVFAFPSLAEGVGLPVLEALACGASVISTTDPAITEVSGGAATLVAPGDRAALGDALDALLSRPDASARARGPARAAAFGLEAMARGTLEVYRGAAGD